MVGGTNVHCLRESVGRGDLDTLFCQGLRDCLPARSRFGIGRLRGHTSLTVTMRRVLGVSWVTNWWPGLNLGGGGLILGLQV